jgi:hypothetical protein
VAGLARAVTELQGDDARAQDIELLQMLSQLSDDEAEMEIKRRTDSGD